MKKWNFIAHGYFTLWVLLLSLIPMASYWWLMPTPDTVRGQVYLFTSIGYYGLLLAALALISAPLAISRWTRPLYALMLSVWLLYLLIDAATFNLYLFHVDWLMIEMFVMDFEGLGLPNIILFAAIAVAVLIAAGCLWLSQHIYQMAAQKSVQQAARQLRIEEQHNQEQRCQEQQEAYKPWSFAPQLLFVGAMLVLFLGNSSLNIWADKYHRQEVSYINPYLPLYRPITSSKHATSLTKLAPNLLPAQQGKMDRAAVQAKSVVRYPIEPVYCEIPQQPKSIIMLVVESWQASALNAEIMPNVARFSHKTTRFEQHISGGSATIPGLFSLFYGLHPSYYPAFKSTPAANPSEFTETLADQGFAVRAFTNSNLDRYSMRRLIFPRVRNSHFYQEKTDAEVVNRFIEQYQNEPSQAQPRFDFVFLTSSHSPYRYPPEFTRFTPLPSVKGGYAFNKHADNTPYKNDYHNSLFYVDHLLGKILDQLEQAGALEHSWVIITGDHAEEFNENQAGFWGHGSNFTRWQTHTPLLVHAPGQKVARLEKNVSSHQDIVPTLMQDALGCKTAVEAYSTGANLFALPEQRSFVMSSYYNNAYWMEGTVLDRSTGKYYAWDDLNKLAAEPDNIKLHQVQEEERRFFKNTESRAYLSIKPKKNNAADVAL